MASKRQLEANRLNARRSTGPSESGKARTRLNAVKHGLTARDVVIGDEDPKAFETLRAELEADFDPSTRIEHELVERLAGLLWREDEPEEETDSDVSTHAHQMEQQFGTGLALLIRDQEAGDVLAKLCRYESGLMNAATRTLQHLHLLRAKRNAARVIYV